MKLRPDGCILYIFKPGPLPWVRREWCMPSSIAAALRARAA